MEAKKKEHPTFCKVVFGRNVCKGVFFSFVLKECLAFFFWTRAAIVIFLLSFAVLLSSSRGSFHTS